MEFDRKIFMEKLDYILGLIRTLKAAFIDEPERLSMEDIEKYTNLLETELVNTVNYIKVTD